MSTRGALCAVSALIAIIVGVGIPRWNAPSGEPQIESHGVDVRGARGVDAFDIAPGTILTYSFSGRYVVRLNELLGGSRPLVHQASTLSGSEHDGTSSQSTNLQGQLWLKVFSSSSHGVRAGVQFLNVQCPDEEKVNPRCREIYESPALVEIARSGEISFLQFSHSLAVSEERKFSALLEPFSITLESRMAWEAHARDAQGEAVFRYTRDDTGVVQRRKLDYITVRGVSDFIDQAEVVTSRGEFSLSGRNGWLENARVQEELALKGGGRTRIEYTADTELRFTPPSGAVPEWVQLSFDEFKALLTRGEKRATSRMQEERAKTTAALIHSDTRGIQRRIAQLAGKMTPSEVLSRCEDLTDWLRLNNDQIGKIPALLRNKSLDEDGRSRVIYSLQTLGTEEAQKILLFLINDGSYSESTRRAALGAMAFMPLTGDTVDVLWSIRNDKRTSEPVYYEMSTLVLGGAARALAEISDLRSREIVGRIQGELETSIKRNDTRDVETLLLALGNSGNAESLPLITRHLESRADSVRRAAVMALVSSEQEPDIDEVAEKLAEEEAATVRTAMTELLLKYPVSEYSFSVAAQVFTEEDDMKARMLLAKYLAKSAEEFPAQRGHVRALLRAESDPTIAKLLGSRANPDMQ